MLVHSSNFYSSGRSLECARVADVTWLIQLAQQFLVMQQDLTWIQWNGLPRPRLEAACKFPPSDQFPQ